ncbi:MAG TPA: hypothetical protein VJR89_07125 [Polyangiales bacterium]|nr:hypothetical protein [Polyangiales bacterium]
MSWSRKVALRAGWMALALVACAPESDDLPRLTPDAGGDAAPAASGCKRAGPGPRSIADVVALLNELPHPVTLPCLVEALPHPLAIHAIDSVFSAQPAVGERSPRIFLFLDPLMLSIVPEGSGGHLLEFGERRTQLHTLKAELEFPITAELGPTAPYDRLPFNEQASTCGFCHGEEEQAEDIAHPFARVSRALKPMAAQRVAIEALRAELRACDAVSEPERCALLEAVFAGGAVTERAFPAEWKMFF